MGELDTRLVDDALRRIPSDDRDTWVRVGMAIKSAGLGFDVFDEWSQSTASDNYSQRDTKSVWHSFKREGGVTIGTLFAMAKQHGWEMPSKRREEDKPVMAEPIELVKPAEINPKLVAWFKTRGIGEDVVRRSGATFVKHWIPGEKAEVWCIALPYVWRGQTINAKYRSINKHFAMVKGAPRPLYNIDALDSDVSFIVEGELDALAMMQAGFDAVVSVPNGAQSIDCLALCEDEVKAVERWVIAVDNDGPGIALERELSRRLGRERCMRVTWPDGCKDANDVLVKHGEDKLRQVVMDAQWYPVGGVLDHDEVDLDARRFHAEGFTPGVKLGWRGLDELYSVQPGEVTVVTGIPGHGKSTWLDNAVIRLAQSKNWRTAFFSPENAPAGRHKALLTEKLSLAPLRGNARSDGVTERTFNKWLERMRNWFDWIEPTDDGDWTLDAILSAARALVFRRGINVLVLDPWNEIELGEAANESTAIGNALRTIRRFARSHDVHVFVVAHPAKLYRDKDGNYPVPTLYDISGSAHFRNRADNGIVVWRDFANDDAPVQIHVQKVRFRHNGRIGMCELRYDPVCATYSDVAPTDNVVAWKDSDGGYGDD